MKYFCITILLILLSSTVYGASKTIAVETEISTTSYRCICGVVDKLISDGKKQVIFFKSGAYIIGCKVGQLDIISTELDIPDDAEYKEYSIKSDLTQVKKTTAAYQVEP